MTQQEVVKALIVLYPQGGWSYVGDGSTLAPHTTLDGSTAPGLGWWLSTPPPTLEVLMAVVVPPPPDWDGFRLDCLNNIMQGDYAKINPLLAKYPSFEMGLRYQNAKMLRAEIARARADNEITAMLEAAFLASAVAHNIP